MQKSLLQITDRGNGEIDLLWVRVVGDSLVPRAFSRPLPFADPVTDQDRLDLRWYLEQSLAIPYGSERDRARRVEERMRTLGGNLFQQIFRFADYDLDPRGFYAEAVSDGLERCELAVASDDPAFLSIPWELIHDPGRGFLAQSLGGFYRQWASRPLVTPPPAELDGPFRILLVVSRPRTDQRASLGTVARPLLRALRDAWPGIQVDVLRPPTFEALQRAVNVRAGYYHLVHFDGPTSFVRARAAAPPSEEGAPVVEAAPAGEGYALFETPAGQPNPVLAKDLAEALAGCQLPLVVLTSGQPATPDRYDPASTVAAGLLAAGQTGVVATSYGLSAGSASRFVGRFYERLAAGNSLVEAVHDCRRALIAEPRRLSVVGPLPLEDWSIPTLYQQATRYYPFDPERPPEPVHVPDSVARVRRQARDACRPGRFGFVGRDDELPRIERALSDPHRPWAVLFGVGGIGKTSLAYGYGRWYQETGGAPGGVFVTSFKHKADFAQVVATIVGQDSDLARLSPEEQRHRLVARLDAVPSLLIWDNFETVSGYPVGSPALASDQDRAELAQFAQELRGSKSRLLIASRKPDESWLGIDAMRVEIGGLAQHDAVLLAEAILRASGKRQSDFRKDRRYSELLVLLGGHPLVMEVVLPWLHWSEPGEIVDALRPALASAGQPLDVAYGFAFDHLSERTQRHLAVGGVFSGVINADVSALLLPREREQYAAIAGELLDRAGWRTVLAEAASTGLVRDLGNGRYELHPTVSPFLRRRLVGLIGEEAARGLDQAYPRFYATFGERLTAGVRRGDAAALSLVAFEEPNLLRALRMALRSGDWAVIQPLVRLLGELYEVQRRRLEATRLREGVLARVGKEPPIDESRASFWRYLTGGQGRDALWRSDPVAAEATFQRLLSHLQAKNDPQLEPELAATYYQLGQVGEARGEPEAAEPWYQRALEIHERRGDEREAADAMQRLGDVAEATHRLEEAESWHQRALEVYGRARLEREAAESLTQLGRINQQWKRPADAARWYGRALTVFERLDLPERVATTMHRLGAISFEKRALEDAEDWYRKALDAYTRLELQAEAAEALHELGDVHLAQNRPDDATNAYERALEIRARLGLHSLQAQTLLALGQVQEARRDTAGALVMVGKAFQLAIEHGLRERSDLVREVARLGAELGSDRFRRTWRTAFRGDEPPLEEIARVVGS